MQASLVLTRPLGQISQSAAYLREHGIEVRELPLTEIQPPARKPSPGMLAFARDADWLIFTSPNAVKMARDYLQATPQRRVIAIGGGTAKLARQQGWQVQWSPQGHSSDAFLAEADAPTLQGRICIIGGSGGRRKLKHALSAQGLTVEKLIVYQRKALSPDKTTFTAALQQTPWVFFSSGHALRQWQHLSQVYKLKQAMDLPLLVASQRLCKLARRLGFTQPPKALPKMSDEALLAALTELTT